MPTAKVLGPGLDLTADLHKWRALRRYRRTGEHHARAALHLDQDQSVLSRRINALERECNARLFNRTGRGVQLSEVGERLFPLVRALLEDAERLELEVNGQAREPAGEVRLGLLPSTAHPLIRRLFSRLRSTLPQGPPEDIRRFERPDRRMADRQPGGYRHPVPLCGEMPARRNGPGVCGVLPGRRAGRCAYAEPAKSVSMNWTACLYPAGGA